MIMRLDPTINPDAYTCVSILIDEFRTTYPLNVHRLDLQWARQPAGCPHHNCVMDFHSQANECAIADLTPDKLKASKASMAIIPLSSGLSSWPLMTPPGQKSFPVSMWSPPPLLRQQEVLLLTPAPPPHGPD